MVPPNKIFSPSGFVGRQLELELIWNQYNVVKSGSARIVLMVGEPGIGKTRLLDEAAVRAVENGATVLRGGTSESEGMPPYLPFLEALGYYIDTTPIDELREKVGLDLHTLANILPRLATRLGKPPTSHPAPPEQERLRLYEAIGTFLEAISISHVLVFTLDDLQWADTASLDLLCYVMRQQSKARLLILSTCREADIGQNPAIDRAIYELNRLRVLTTVTVHPFSLEETEKLAVSYLTDPPDKNVSLLLQAQSEGNPFFAEEILRCWIETGTLVQRDGQWIAAAPLEHTLPHSIVGALRQRFTRLPTFVIDHLRIAAVIGRTFDVSLLAEVEGQEVEVVEEIIYEAVQARLVRAGQNGLFTFSHDKIRETLYAEVSDSRCKRLHKAICQILEIRHNQDDFISLFTLAQLAFHASQSGDIEQGVNYSKMAAQQALRSFAIDDALIHYHEALKFLDPGDERYAPLLLEAGQAMLLVGNNEQAMFTYQEALNRFLQRDMQTAAGQAAHGLALAQWRQEALPLARESLERALALSEQQPDTNSLQTLVDLSILLTIFMGQRSEGNAYAEQALTRARESGDSVLEAKVSWATAGQYLVSGDNPMHALHILEHGLAHIETEKNPAKALEYCLYLAELYYYTANLKQSYEINQRGIHLIEGYRYPYQLRYSHSWSAFLHTSRGAWKEAELALEQAQPLVNRLSSPAPLAFFHQVRGFLAYQREDYVTAEREFQTMRLTRSRSPTGLVYAGLLGLIQATMGKHEGARISMTELEVSLAEMPPGTLSTAPIMLCLALIAMTLNDQKQVALLYPKLLIFRHQYHWFLVDRVLGNMAAFLGQEEQAMAHLLEAEATAKREELRLELAHILAAQAHLYVKTNAKKSVPQATLLFKQALVLSRELNLSQSSSNIQQHLLKLSSNPNIHISQSLPVSLTPSEARVLQIVVKGKSNRQIAKELGISEKTVANHLSRIFSKTASDNRAAAAAFAIRHGLD